MSKICQVTGKKPISGHKISHSNIKTKRRFEPNLHTKRFWLPNENRYIRLTVSAHGLRIIDKKGIEAVIKEMQERGEAV